MPVSEVVSGADRGGGCTIDMSCMFYLAKAFNQPLNSWNVSNVTDMCGMFFMANSFNQPLDSWQVTDRTVTSDMFLCSKLKSLPEWFR